MGRGDEPGLAAVTAKRLDEGPAIGEAVVAELREVLRCLARNDPAGEFVADRGAELEAMAAAAAGIVIACKCPPGTDEWIPVVTS